MYIDPNTGGMLFQILAVSFGIISAGVLIFSGRIRMLLAKAKRKASSSTKTEEPGTISTSETPTLNP